jgi:hypothetical protein
MIIIVVMTIIVFMKELLFGSTNFKTTGHLSSREPPRSGKTPIETPVMLTPMFSGKPRNNE